MSLLKKIFAFFCNFFKKSATRVEPEVKEMVNPNLYTEQTIGPPIIINGDPQAWSGLPDIVPVDEVIKDAIVTERQHKKFINKPRSMTDKEKELYAKKPNLQYWVDKKVL